MFKLPVELSLIFFAYQCLHECAIFVSLLWGCHEAKAKRLDSAIGELGTLVLMVSSIFIHYRGPITKSSMWEGDEGESSRDVSSQAVQSALWHFLLELVNVLARRPWQAIKTDRRLSQVMGLLKPKPAFATLLASWDVPHGNRDFMCFSHSFIASPGAVSASGTGGSASAIAAVPTIPAASLTRCPLD